MRATGWHDNRDDGAQVYVTRVQLTDIKGFSGSRAVDLKLPGRGGWMVLAGRNGSGKSSLLQTVALALAGPDAALRLNVDFTGWITRGAEHGDAAVDVLPDPETDPMTVPASLPEPGEEIRLRLAWRTVQLPGAEDDWPHRPSVVMDHWPDPALTPIAFSGPWMPEVPGWFCAGYGPFRRLTGPIHRAYNSHVPVPAPIETLFHENATLAESVSWVLDLHYRSLQEYSDARRSEGRPDLPATLLLSTVMGLLDDGLLPHQYRLNGVSPDGLLVSLRGSDESFPLREMSDGFRTVAALVLDIIRQIHAAYGRLQTERSGSGRVAVLQPGVVLIDEIDAHLHVTWQRRIGDWLREHFPNIQFIVTTHSPYVCQAADEGALVRLPGPEEDEPPAVVDEDLYRRVVYGGGDDAVLSELFGLDTPYSSRAERHRQRLVALERKVYAGTALPEEVSEYKELSRLLTSSVQSRVAEVAARLETEQ
ncbi:ATP-binding protein [Streptomyces phaeochromogenes]|uniref:AAA family ATPase n=1 Tax=Streptomyces phaeochromogenes TaxID=1923 RepID=UPI0022586870|nr:ATP-binding protein [Streptomyces phaeochromogenes]MCX5602943.1 ATP-binding protein [Streptomyces phaeochromogenes]